MGRHGEWRVNNADFDGLCGFRIHSGGGVNFGAPFSLIKYG